MLLVVGLVVSLDGRVVVVSEECEVSLKEFADFLVVGCWWVSEV